MSCEFGVVDDLSSNSAGAYGWVVGGRWKGIGEVDMALVKIKLVWIGGLGACWLTGCVVEML